MSHGKPLTENELEQRREASVKHGADTLQARGVSALDQPGRSRYAELGDFVDDRPGVVDLLKERAKKAVLACELVEGYVLAQAADGKDIGTLAALYRLPAFHNSAQRALMNLYAVLPAGPGPESEELVRILEVVGNAEQKDRE